jgi:hypothetical protein
MLTSRPTLNAALAIAAIGIVACGSDDDGGGGQSSTASYPAQECVAVRQEAAGDYCRAVLDAWASWETDQDATARDGKISSARADLNAAWSDAAEQAAAEGAGCTDRALTAGEAAGMIDPATNAIVTEINGGLDLGTTSHARCGSDAIVAAARKCSDLLASEARRLRNLEDDADRSRLDSDREDADRNFARDWANAVGSNCPTTATESGIGGAVDELTGRIVLDTIVTPHLESDVYATISPTGTTEYLGDMLTPVCMEGSPYHFFARRGTVNKLVMYYQGGGACWEGLTCSIPTCDANVNPEGSDNPTFGSTGFADRNNPDNPFRDWHTVFVSYCSCDVHYGDAAQDYPLGDGTLHVEHRGFHNARVAEKWAREHFLNPEVVFVTGSSAGAYGAWFNSVALHDVWPASQFHVLADAGNGVITREFLDGPFANWDFVKNLPDDIPGLREAIEDGSGIVGYTEAVTDYFPETNWAHYTTAYDGGAGGQTGFYAIMLNDNNPAAALTWWTASCPFNDVMREQAITTAAVAPSNYRYYIGTGSRHTMFGSNKVYDDTTGGVPTIVDWVNAMLASTPASPDPGWTNVECENCGLTLAGDPTPPLNNLQPPFEQAGDDIVINCSPE